MRLVLFPLAAGRRTLSLPLLPGYTRRCPGGHRL